MSKKKNILTRPDDIELELATGLCFIVRPYTRAQLREAIELDPGPDEIRSVVEASSQRALQLEALAGPTVRVKQADGSYLEQPSAPVLSKLTPAEEQEALVAILASGQGQDAKGMVALHRLAKKKAILGQLIASSDFQDTMNKPPSSQPPSGGQ